MGAGDSAVGLIGRDDERARIDAALGAGGDRASVVLIEGAAGIGKTSLAEGVVAAWRDRGGTARWARCWDGPGTPPLWPWSRLLGSELDAEPSSAIGGRTTEADMFERFELAVDVLASLAADSDMLVVIDDVHWADPASIELLRFVVRHPHCARLRVLVTARTPDVASTPHAVHLIELAAQGTLVRLEGLGVDAVASLVAALGGPTDRADEIHRRTGGNPLFVSELARAGVDGDGAVPRSLEALVGRHLARFEPVERTLVHAAAIQGQFFDLDVAATAAGIDRDDAEEIIGRAERLEFVRHTGDGWAFVHALVGDAIVAPLDRDSVRRLHVATADAIEKHHHDARDEQATTIVGHLVESGRWCPPDRLVVAAIAASRVASARAAWEDEARYLGMAVEARRALRDDHAGPLVDLLVERCRALKAARLFDEAREVASEAARLVGSIDDVDRLVEVALVYPPDSEGVEIDEIHDPDQVRLRELALERLPDGPSHDAARSRLEAALALALYWETALGDRADGHLETASRRHDLTASALDRARRLGDDSLLAGALDARIHATWGPETVDERARLADELFDVARRERDIRRVLAARVWKVAERLESCDLAGADKEIAAFEADADRINDPIARWTVTRWRSNRAFMVGDLDGCEALSATALAQASAVLPEHVSMSFYVTMVGPVHYLRCSLGDDLAVIEQIGDESPDVPAWRVGLSVALAENDRVDEAATWLHRLASHDFAALPRDLNFFGSMMMLALVARSTGDTDAAALIAANLAPRSGRYAIHGTGYTSYGPTDLGLGQCYDAMGRTDEADAHYRAAIEMAVRVGTPYEHVARLLRGSMLVSTDREQARRELTTAARGFRAFDLDLMAGRADEALGRLATRSHWQLARRADGWDLVRPDGTAASLPKLKGLAALVVLVERPNDDVHALDLGAALDGHAVVGEASIERLDRSAIRQYETRLTELAAELDRADRRGDVAASERLERERDALVEELRVGRGLGGRVSTDPSAADRARVNVTKHLRRTIDRLRSVDAAFARHLDSAVSTGMHCGYAPVGDEQVTVRRSS